jgi:hypothetical protein
MLADGISQNALIVIALVVFILAALFRRVGYDIT